MEISQRNRYQRTSDLRCDSPPGGQFMGAAQDDRQYDPPLPVVDLVTGRCKPGKVS